MTKALYLVGAPASGKSTTMAAVYDLLGAELGEVETLWPGHRGIFKGQRMHSILDGSEIGVSLGVQREGGFPGTDGLSMAAPPVAIEWIEEAPELPPLIVGEGNRLSTDGFMQALAQRTELVVGHLVTTGDILDQRCAERGSNQQLQWRKAAETRAQRAAHAASGAGAEVRLCDSGAHEPGEIARQLLDALGV